jgi:hypothetical protein
MKHVFILSYIGSEYLSSWFNPENFLGYDFHIVDNGQQVVPNNIKNLVVATTTQNIGCAGGWNLICKIAFEYLNLDKIIIGQDDAQFTNDMLDHIWDETNDNTIAGAYDRSFEFSLFGITKKFWEDVGEFDENFVYVTCEDDDYKYRSKLMNKKVISLGYSADLNKSLTSKTIYNKDKNINLYNKAYILQKWNNYTAVKPFDGNNYNQFGTGLLDVYGDIKEFPSLTEFEYWKRAQFNG